MLQGPDEHVTRKVEVVHASSAHCHLAKNNGEVEQEPERTVTRGVCMPERLAQAGL